MKADKKVHLHQQSPVHQQSPASNKPQQQISASKLGKKRKSDPGDSNEVEKALTELITVHKRSREGLATQMKENIPNNINKTAEQMFFSSCASRMERMNEQTKSFLQFQISQFFNAKNQEVPPQNITLCHATSQDHCHSSSSCSSSQVPNTLLPDAGR